MKAKPNRLFNFILGILMSAFLLAGSVYSIINNIDIDINKSKNISGKVIYTDVREIENFSFRYSSYSRVFYFLLDNSDQDFAVQNAYQQYQSLDASIKIGDSIKVYYGNIFKLFNDYNRKVYQIEKDDIILVNYENYNRNASGKAGISLFIGVLLLTYTIMWYKRFNLFKFMNSLVESKKYPTSNTK